MPTNLLIYAVDEDSPFHTTARACLEDALSGTETGGFAWIVLLGFLRLTTRPQVCQVRFSEAGFGIGGAVARAADCYDYGTRLPSF
ncbi:MAG TPA: hypothetical protein VH640_09425 [Bryobacteraceae bacterium]